MHAGAQDYKHEVDPDLLDYADSNYGTKSSLFSSLFGDYAKIVMRRLLYTSSNDSKLQFCCTFCSYQT